MSPQAAQWVTAMGGGGVWGDVWNLLKLWNFQHWKVHGPYFCTPDTFFNSFELCGGRIEPLNWPERAPFQNLHHNYFSCCQICICPFSCTVGLSVAWHEMGSVKFNVYSCVTCKYTNTITQIQIHKYTNTASIKVADRPNMCYIFEKVMVRGPQKQCSQVSDVQIHKYKYTNTQIQLRTKLQIDLPCAIFLKG